MLSTPFGTGSDYAKNEKKVMSKTRKTGSDTDHGFNIMESGRGRCFFGLRDLRKTMRIRMELVELAIFAVQLVEKFLLAAKPKKMLAQSSLFTIRGGAPFSKIPPRCHRRPRPPPLA